MQSFFEKKVDNNVHDIIGRIEPAGMLGKPIECLQAELSVKYRTGDVFIVTFPKTGTTMLQYMCHLLRTGADDRANDFDHARRPCATHQGWSRLPRHHRAYPDSKNRRRIICDDDLYEYNYFSLLNACSAE